jgi:hypothetical protein
MENIQYSTFNSERRSFLDARLSGHWMLNVERSMLKVLLSLLLLAPSLLLAQAPPQVPPGGLIQLQVAQPTVDITTPENATAAFDPPVVRAGGNAFYRVTVDATEASIQWPDKIAAPPELRFGPKAHGQVTRILDNKAYPHTTFVYAVRAAATGHFAVTNFTVNVYGKPVNIPAASLEVIGDDPNLQPARQLVLETSATNIFTGEPFHVTVMLPADSSNAVEALREVQINGDGLMTDRTAAKQSIEEVNINGQLKPAYICELVVTPIAAGPVKFSAQAFTAGQEFSGPITIRGKVTIPGGQPNYVLLISDEVEINVRTLPSEGKRPGFTGAVGKYFHDPPQLSTNRLRVGELAHLNVVFHGEGDLTRLKPPVPPRSRDWQIIPDNPPDTGYTLIPLTDTVRETPAIPFSYFDPESGKYLDLTIPSLPVTVIGEALPEQSLAMVVEPESASPLKLSQLAPAPGKTMGSLEPLQMRGWFVGLQLAPVIGFLALWQWDRRRRFLEAHPEVVRCRQARRALRSEKKQLQKAVAAADAAAFVRHAVEAMRIAVAPRDAANPRALVCADVLAQLDGADQNGRVGETVRKMFAAADAQFASSAQTQADCLALESDVEALLQQLEGKL